MEPTCRMRATRGRREETFDPQKKKRGPFSTCPTGTFTSTLWFLRVQPAAPLPSVGLHDEAPRDGRCEVGRVNLGNADLKKSTASKE